MLFKYVGALYPLLVDVYVAEAAGIRRKTPTVKEISCINFLFIKLDYYDLNKGNKYNLF